MQIPIEFSEYETKTKSHDSVYVKILIEYLQKDLRFERLILQARKKLSINTPSQIAGNKVAIISHSRLRSEEKALKEIGAKIKLNPRIESYSSTNTDLIMEAGKITKEYCFLKDWEAGVARFILDNIMTISLYNSHLKLRVNSRKYKYIGSFTDVVGEEGVKIVITAPITEKQFVLFFNEYKEIINAFLSKKNKYINLSKRSNFERDRLIYYLRTYLKMKWVKIADLIQESTNQQLSEEALQEAYKDFPFSK